MKLEKKLITRILKKLEQFVEEIGRLNCKWNHPYSKLTRPVQKQYRCLICMREYEVPYE